MKIFEYDVLTTRASDMGRAIPDDARIRFWIDDYSFIEVSVDKRKEGTLEIRAMGHQYRLEIAPVATNTFTVSLKE